MEKQDAELLQQLLRDPEQGIPALQAQYGGLILSVVNRILPHSPSDAEETAADVLVSVWQQAENLLENERPFTAWLAVTARNKAIDRWRVLKRRKELPAETELPLPEEPFASEGEQLIEDLVTAMDEPDREIFLRRYYRMETAEEIGQALGMRAHAVNVRLSRGRERLKKLYLNKMKKGGAGYERAK